MGVEHVRHAVDEDPSRLAPAKWLIEPRFPEPGSKGVRSIRRRVFDGDSPQVRVPNFGLSQGQGVAVIAAPRDLCAACHGVPRGVRPLNAGFQAHRDLLWETVTSIPNRYRMML